MILVPLKLDSHDRKLWTGISVVLHFAVIAMLSVQTEPVIVKTSLLMKGDDGKSMSLVYLAAKQNRDSVDPSQTTEPSKFHLPRKQKAKAKPPRPVSDRDVVAKNESPKAGLANGSMYDGLMSGHDVRPALPIVSPDPPVTGDELHGAEGDVIVEVTIDVRGEVIQTRLLQGIGHGVEQIVIAVVQRWKFKPATQDGIPIASRQDVHFHYPS